MKKKIDQILNGKFEHEQPDLLFSKEKLDIRLEAGSTMQGDLYFGTENNDRIQGYITSSSRRFVPGSSRFSGTTVRLSYGIDGTGMNPGEVCRGWLCITSTAGEYKLPFTIEATKTQVQSLAGKVNNMDAFCETAQKDFAGAYHLFASPSFEVVMNSADERQKALYAGLAKHPVSCRDMEEFLIGMGKKEPVSISLKTMEAEFYNVKESIQESFVIKRSGWGYLHLEIETKGDFLEAEKRVLTEDDFIGSSARVSYLIHADKLKAGNQLGEILIKGSYQQLKYQVLASGKPQSRVDIHREEKKLKLSLAQDYLEYQEGRIDGSTWHYSSRYNLNQLKENGCEYPEYQLYEAWLLYLNGQIEEAKNILKNYHSREFTREELELAGIYLYLCTMMGLYRNQEQAVWKLRNFYRQREDSFQLLWILFRLDSSYKNSSSAKIFAMEEIYEKGCCSPLLYQEAWNMISEEPSLLHRLTPFWMQVFCYAGRRKLLTEELVMRLAYLSGYEKKFYGSLYKALAAGYEQFSSDEILEAICKYIMKGEPRKPEYFKWFSLAVSQGLRLTRLFEYYVETMDITYRRPLPKPLLMYFAYNDNSLGDARKAYVYASVIAYKEQDPRTYENYADVMERFAYRKIRDGEIDENYAVIYQEFLFDPTGQKDGERIAPKLFTYRLYCDDRRIEKVIVCHSRLKREEVYACDHGVAYPRIYTEDAVILFEDDRHRRYASSIPYNLKKLTDETEIVLKLIALGVEETGLLLQYCENTDLNIENLECFQKLADLPECTEEYKRSIRRRILDFYASNVQGTDLDRYLEKIDYREYAQVDRTALLEILISRRMFRQAFAIVEEFGYEGLNLSSLLKMTSRMILKSDMAEDDELLALASEVFRNDKYDEVILHYLMQYRYGPLNELFSIWKSAKGFEMDTYDLEERILSLLVFTGDYRKDGEKILESYVKQSGKERIIGAYLTLLSYGTFVKEYSMSPFVRSRLEYAYTSKWPVNKICRLALLKEISKEADPKPEYVGIAQDILEECARNQLQFAFFHKLSPELLSPYQLDDKIFAEYHGRPGASVTLFYKLDTGLGTEVEYSCEPLKEMYEGIFVRAFTLFYGESLHYYFQITQDGHTDRTPERVMTMQKIEGRAGSKYHALNQMLSARHLGRHQEVTEKLNDYLRREQCIRNMFKIEKESGK